MKLIIDINHPAHIHYFRNLIYILRKNGHQIKVFCRDREHINYLSKYYNIAFISKGKRNDSSIGQIQYMLKCNYLLLRHSIQFKPDLFISFSSPYAAQVSYLLRKPHIAFNDTEHADVIHKKMTYPFSDCICTPSCFYEYLGEKQIRFDSFMEYAYLHPNYFSMDQRIYNYLGVPRNEKFFLLRFVSWSALHDQGHSGLDLATRRILVSNLLSYGKVFISSEGSLEAEFEPFRLTLPPELVHSCLAAADLFIAESGTMASESAILGTPVIYVNSLPLMGYLREEENQGLLFHFHNSVGVVNKATELVEGNYKQCAGALAEKLLHNKIDVTKFMVWLVENYPESKKILSDNPQYQYNFL